MKTGFHNIIATVRAALEKQPLAPPLHDGHDSPKLPVTTDARRAELIARFASEVERVNGHFMGTMTLPDASAKIVGLARELDARAVAVGEGVSIDAAAFSSAVRDNGFNAVQTTKTTDPERLSIRDRLAKCDLAVVEANYAIASTGTLVMVATPGQPGSMTLLPPVNVILVDAEHVLPDMAAVIKVLGTETITNHRVVFITGPSRTADIEKMIVIGVHGPKQLYAGVIWRGQPHSKR